MTSEQARLAARRMSIAQLAQIKAINAEAAAPLDAVLVDARALPVPDDTESVVSDYGLTGNRSTWSILMPLLPMRTPLR